MKKPSNRNSLPKLIISEVDSQNLLEFKVKYEKLGRLDRFIIKQMHYDGSEIVFDEVVANGGLLEFEYRNSNKEIAVNIGNKVFSIKGKKVGGKKRLREERISRAKVQLTLTDSTSSRSTTTESELLDSIDIFSAIAGREIKSSKDIYLIKRYLVYRSDLLLYYGFVNNFFKVAGNNKELWRIDFNSASELIDYFKFAINDNLKNSGGYLENYIKDRELIKKDLNKAKDVFRRVRHALMHFDYDFFEKLFNEGDLGLDLDIEFLNIAIKSIDKLNIDTKKEFIDNQEIDIFGKKIKLSQLYKLYAHIAINRVAFNKLTNSFIMQDGVENQELKEFFNSIDSKDIAYYIDIHQNREYKELYIIHKNIISKLSATTDGKKIAELNKEIQEIKEQMKQITKANSLSRLEYKLRLAFGFIFTKYGSYKNFKNSFDRDIKGKKFDNIDIDKLKEYYNATNSENSFDITKIFKSIDSLKLADIITNSQLLKVVMLFFIFLPQEIKGEFLGFIKKYYHDIKHIDEDTKDKNEEFQDSFSTSFKLKILHKNIRSLSILKHSLSLQAKYNKKDESFYESGNSNAKLYKNVAISHNQEEFDKTIYTPLFRYYCALYKLINDLEIYALFENRSSNETLSDMVAKNKFKHIKYYNFRTLMEKTDNIHKCSQFHQSS